MGRAREGRCAGPSHPRLAACPDRGAGRVSRAGAGKSPGPPCRACPRNPPVGSAAAQEDVLAVVEHEAVALERPRRATEARPPFKQRHRCRRVRAGDRRRQAGEPAPDDDDVRPAPSSCRLRPPQAADRHPGLLPAREGSRDGRARASGSLLDAVEQAVVDPRHRRDTGPRTPVEQVEQPETLLVEQPRPVRPRTAAVRRARPAGRSRRRAQPKRGEILRPADRRAPSRSRSSTMSRKMFVSCRAMPSLSASSGAVAGSADPNTPSESRPTEPATHRQ